jgi:hypothetical protein
MFLINQYPVCDCGHSKHVHRTIAKEQLEYFKTYLNNPCDPKNICACFCRNYIYNHTKHYFDKYLATDILKSIGKVIGVILLVILTIFSLSTLVLLGSAFVVAIPAFLIGLFGKR